MHLPEARLGGDAWGAMDRFIAKENIKFYSARLRTEADAATRRRLHSLLLEELDRLDADLEFIVEIERAISAFDALIETQRKLVMMLERDGPDGDGRAKSLLDGLVESQAVYRSYHRRAVRSLGLACVN